MAVTVGKKKGTNEVDVETSNANGVEEVETPAVKKAPKSTTEEVGTGLSFISSLQQSYGVFKSFGDNGSLDSLLNTKHEGASVMEFIQNNNIGLEMTVLDRNIDNNLLYSFPIVYRVCDDHIKYTPLLLTSTGRKPLTAAEYSKKAEIATKNPDMKTDVYTYASALNDVIDTKAIGKLKSVLSKELKNKGLVTFSGKVVNTDLPDLGTSIGILKSCLASIAADYGADDSLNDGVGINIGKIKEANNVRFRYDIQILKNEVVTDNLASPIRADFALNLYVDAGANIVNWKLNDGALSEKLITLYGYFTALPNYVPESRDQFGNIVPATYVVSPHLIITGIRSLYPDLPSTLLGIAASYLIFTNKQHVRIIHDTITADNNPGSLNVLTRWVTDDKGRVAPIDFTKKNKSVEEHLAVIDEMFKGTPVISVDVKLFGEGFNTLEILKASYNNKNALNDVKEAVKILTDGKCEITNTPVFAIQKQPAGYYFDRKNIQRDIRDWEIERYLAADPMLEDVSALNLMLQAMNLNAGKASYGYKIDVLAGYLKDGAFIDGEIDRLTISPEFMSNILNGLSAAGLVISADPTYVYTPTNIGINMNYVDGYNMALVGGNNIVQLTGPQNQGYTRHIFHNPFLVQGYEY